MIIKHNPNVWVTLEDMEILRKLSIRWNMTCEQFLAYRQSMNS